jgi:hypothetical protein
MVVIDSLAITGYDQAGREFVTLGSQAGTGTAVILSGLTIHSSRSMPLAEAVP